MYTKENSENWFHKTPVNMLPLHDVINKSISTIIKNKILRSFALSWLLHKLEINVEVRQGRAMLTGKVASQFQKTEAESIARETQGISEVQNKLEVEPMIIVSD
nr:BON domain-containing protein [Bacteroidota bacterium]